MFMYTKCVYMYIHVVYIYIGALLTTGALTMHVCASHLRTLYILLYYSDTYSVESFNHMMLTYVSKQIHFSTRTFSMRMQLAVLDWVLEQIRKYTICHLHAYVTILCIPQNQNVNRVYTITQMVADLHRPDCRTAIKVLVEKTYNFVDSLWESYINGIFLRI